MCWLVSGCLEFACNYGISCGQLGISALILMLFAGVPRQALGEANERLQHVMLEMLKSAMATEELISRKVGACLTARMPSTGTDSGLEHTTSRTHGGSGDGPGTGGCIHALTHMYHILSHTHLHVHTHPHAPARTNTHSASHYKQAMVSLMAIVDHSYTGGG